jgi:ATP-dependent exoDNAse (exonuclease V) alpha subunit
MFNYLHLFVSADCVISEPGADDDTTLQYPLEYLRSLRPSGLPAGEIRLKKGCPVILLRNLAPLRGLCNGTRCIILEMSQRVLEVQIMGGQYDGRREFIPRIALTPSNNNGQFAFLLKRRQFPIRLAFAMTINKAQGQSVDCIGLDLRVPVFAHGQLYVALSRATSSRRIKVLLPEASQTAAQNVVYPEVLLD